MGSGVNPPGVAPRGAASKPTIAIASGVAAAVIAPVIVYALTVYTGLGQAVPLLIVGPMVGLAMKFTSAPSGKTLAWVAVGLTLAACVVGFVWADSAVWTPFMLQQTIRRLLSLMGIIVLAGSAYLAYILAPSV